MVEGLHFGDGIELLKGIPDSSVDLILTDPPYEQKYEFLFSEMAEQAPRVLKTGGSLVTLCGHYQILTVGNCLERYLRFWWCGGMLHSTLKRLPGKWVCIQGKPMLWFVNERRKKGDTQCPVDYMDGGGKDKRFHKWGQPVDWFKHWIERLTGEGELVVDPFLGGGAVAVAALETGRRFKGAEIDCDQFEIAKARVREVSNGTKMS